MSIKKIAIGSIVSVALSQCLPIVAGKKAVIVIADS